MRRMMIKKVSAGAAVLTAIAGFLLLNAIAPFQAKLSASEVQVVTDYVGHLHRIDLAP